MFYKTYLIFYTFSLTAIEEGIAICAQGSYLNLCGYCVGGTTNKNELEGLDRCNICDGRSDCVGCDGIINSPRRRDICGLCLSPQTEHWNDCRKIDRVYPSVIDLSLDRDMIPLTIAGAGLKQSFLNSTHCLIQPLESQTDNPEVKEIALEENNIQLKVLLTESTGAYRIGCSEIEGFAALTLVDSRKLNVLKVNPSDVKVDEIVEFELEIEESKNDNSNNKFWCFVKMEKGEASTLVARRKSGTSFSCNPYAPVAPGTMTIGIVASEEAAFIENGSGKTVPFFARAKPPVPESAEYFFDTRTIVVKFDQNIQIDECKGTFSPKTEKSLGKGFSCTVVGDRLRLNLGNESEIAESLTIAGTNSIRRSGTTDVKLSPNADSTVLPVSKGKVMAPSLSLSVPSTICPDEETQPDIYLTVSKLGNQQLNYIWTVPPTKEWKGKSQRENMLMWKNARTVQAALKNASASDHTVLSRKNLQPGITYNIRLTSINSVGERRDVTGQFQIQKSATLSVAVKTFPSTSTIIAEAGVIFCRNKEEYILRYKWMVDDQVVSTDGRLLRAPRAKPGDYNVSCTVSDYESGRILGAGWAIAQIVKVPGRLFIFPTEAVFGTMDEIVLHAYTTESEFRWSCATSYGEACITVGPKAQSIDFIVNMTSPIIRIPGGALSVGRYVWTLHGSEEASATVIVSSGIPPAINIVPPLPRIDSTKPISLNADVTRLREGCKIRWKTMHKKGYGYFGLEEDVGLGDPIEIKVDDLVTDEREAPLVVPAPRGKWKGLVGNEKYLFRLETICPDPIPEAHSDVTLLANGPPSPSDFAVSPETGEAVTTKFDIRIHPGSDAIQDYPLTYSLSFRDESGDEISLATTASTNFKVSLPPGNISIIVKTCDAWKSCSKSRKLVTVENSFNVSSGTLDNLEREIRNLMLSGDTAEAHGTAIVALKSFSSEAELKDALLRVSSATGSAVRGRVRDLSERLKSDPKLVKPSFEFLEQSVASLKYFPDAEGMAKLLKEFKKSIANSSALKRSKREAGADPGKLEVNESLIKAALELHSRNFENSDSDEIPEEMAADARKFMLELCSDARRGPFVIDSSAIAFRISRIDHTDANKELPIADVQRGKLVLNNIIKPGSCLATARYSKNPLPDSGRSSDIFEIRLVREGNIENVAVVVGLPTSGTTSHQKCFAWSQDWNETCIVESKSDDLLTCRCSKSGYISVFDRYREAEDGGASSKREENPSVPNRPELSAHAQKEGTVRESASNSWDLSRRNKRGSASEFANDLSDIATSEGTVKAIFDLHGKILEQNRGKSNREEFLADVRKYMIEICGVIQDSVRDRVLIESTIVALEVKKLLQSDLKKEVSVAGAPDAKLKFNFKSPPRKTCVAVAKYHKFFMENTTNTRISDMYEVRLIKNGTFRDDIKTVTVTIPISNNVSLGIVNCAIWSDESGWTPQCNLKAKTNSTVTCSCKDPGMFAVFSADRVINITTVLPVTNATTTATTALSVIVNKSAATTTTVATLVKSSPTSSVTSATNATATTVVTKSTRSNNGTTSTKATTTSPAPTFTTTKEEAILTSVIQNISNIRKNASLYVSGTFKINENYDATVGNNVTVFCESLKKQIAEQLKIPIEAIANIIVTPGSIIVTVVFVDTESASAEDAIRELVTKLHEGTLRLFGSNKTVLDVQRQDLKVKVGPNLTRNTSRMRLITYGVVAGTCLAIFLFALGAIYIKRKRRRMPLRLPHLSIDDHPTYRQFHNEFSLDGSSTSLARYRRDHPFESETIQ